jgi:flagellar basal-body rod modification protein FlgD
MKIGTVSAVVRSTNGFLLDLGSLGDVAFKDVQQIL